MFKQLPIKKEYLLMAGTLVLLLISYQLAFKKTIAAWQFNSQLKAQLVQATDVGYQPAYLARKMKNLNQIITLYKTDTVAFRNNIISAIASIAEKENVKLTEVPTQDPLYHTNQFIIQQLDFEGDFFALTRMLNQLQSAKGVGVPRSATFKVLGARSKADEVKKLVLEVYLETAR